jgi:Zn-dependent metalloprotease
MRKFRVYVGLPLLAACASVAACSSEPDSGTPDLASRLEKDTGTQWTVYTDPRSHEVRFLAPKTPVQIAGATPEEKARTFFDRYRDALHTSGKSDEIRIVSTARDSRGGIHVRFAHLLPGTELPVFGSGSTAHFTEDGAVYWLETDFRADLADVDGNATVTKEQAIAKALAHVKSSCGALVAQREPTATAAELGVVSDPDTHAALAYRVPVSTDSQRCLAPMVFIDAKSGAPLKIEESAHGIQEPTVGGSLFHRAKDFRDVKPISITTVPGAPSRFQMVSDDASSTRVITRSFPSGAVIASSKVTEWDLSSPAKGAAVDAHFHTREALKFLRPFASGFQAHDRAFVFPLSLDVDVFVHENTEANGFGFNAFASFDSVAKRDTIHFGDGNFPTIPNALPFSAAYDVVAHELTHLVTAHTSNLTYARESGALNESFSDVMGAAAEHAREPNDQNNFLIGEGLFLPGVPGPMTVLRSMTAPRSTGNPDHTDDLIPCPASGPTVDNDECGVHSNSGIPNRAFSLIVAGGGLVKFVDGKPAGPRTLGVENGIGWESATELTYWATTGLTKDATFENAALAQIAEAGRMKDLAAGIAVTCAWHAVGVLKVAPEIEPFLLTTGCRPKPPPAPPPPPEPPPPGGACAGHGDALICDPLLPAQAIQCKNGAPLKDGTEFCADGKATCKQVSASDPTAVKDANGLVCE